jgi:DNA-binding transcriptional MerR regulator
MDKEPMRIGRLARRTDVSIKTLRFYDSQRLLLTAGRSAANYRLFPEDAVLCVNGIRTLKAAGLTIRDLREIAAAHRAGGDCEVLLRRKLAQVLERLNRMEAELQASRARLLNLLGDVRVVCQAATS